MRVALVVMPFAAITRPSLAAGLLQANLLRAGILCDTIYANLVLGDMLGTSYRQFSTDAATTTLAGEWAFSQILFGQRLSDWESYRGKILDDPDWGASASRYPAIQTLLALAPAFLNRVFTSHDWQAYDLVGFTSSFEQTMPSLCLARMIRDRHPATLLAVGGANFRGEMGQPYLDHFDCLDFVSTGEADTSFTALCEQLRDHAEGRAATITVPEGILFRTGGRLPLVAGERTPAFDPESSPTPNYDDFFAAVTDTDGAASAHDHWLPIEASRGYAWNEKTPYTHSGLKDSHVGFRAKSAGKVLDESRELVERYGNRQLQFADSVLGAGYFETLLPQWVAAGDTVQKCVGIRPDLSREQLALLRRAGVTAVQAGVGSLSDRTLEVMGRDVIAAQNIAVLRWCAELGLDPLWSLFYAVPGEDLADYDAMLDVIGAMTHLPPPETAGPLRLHRFSPDFSDWRERGFASIEPIPAYRHILPFSAPELAGAAYYFRYEHPQLIEARVLGLRIETAVADWQHRHRAGTCGHLYVDRMDGRFVLVDTRQNMARGPQQLDAVDLAWVLACDRPVSRTTVEARVARLGPGTRLGTARATLDRLMDERVIVQVGTHLVTLACIPQGVRDACVVPRVSMDWPTRLAVTTG